MPSLRSILFLLTIWGLAMGCGSEKNPPSLGDNPNNRPDSSTQPPDTTPEAGTPETSTPADMGTVPPPNVCDAGSCGITLTAAATTIPADGKARDEITASVDARLGGFVEFTITGAGLWDNLKTSITAQVDTFGKARAIFVSDVDGGTAIITAKPVGRTEAAQVAIEMPALADITSTAQHNLMGVQYSGFNESNQITFKLFAPNGVPYPDGLEVTLEHKPLSGSTIATEQTCTMLDCVIKHYEKTARGQVSIPLISGTLQGVAIVTIIATAGGQTKRVDVSSQIVGAKVSGRNVSIECSPRNVPALFDTDCVRSRVDAPFKCTVTLGDRFNNVVGVATTVKYQSEAGIVGTPPTTPMFPSPDLGKATGTIGTVGGVLPLDVFPLTDEHSFSYADRCHPSGPSTHNPRDGIVSVIAMIAGEEGFIDKNGDGKYNQGEPFIDLAEPFVDSNDNGVWDAGEFFADLNGNNQWNPADGSWNEKTTLWAETRIVYTADPAGYVDNMDQQYFSRFFALATTPGTPLPPDPTPPVTRPQLMADQSYDVGLWFADSNFNVLAPTVKYTVEVGTGDPITAAFSQSSPMRPKREEGFFFAQTYCDGAALSTCGAVCPPSPATQQCLVKSAVTGFEYGVAGGVRIKASNSTKGAFLVTGTATLPNGVGSVGLGGDVR